MNNEQDMASMFTIAKAAISQGEKDRARVRELEAKLKCACKVSDEASIVAEKEINSFRQGGNKDTGFYVEQYAASANAENIKTIAALTQRVKELETALYSSVSDPGFSFKARVKELEAELSQEKTWKNEDPRMLREQIRVADEAFNHLNSKFAALTAACKAKDEALRSHKQCQCPGHWRSHGVECVIGKALALHPADALKPVVEALRLTVKEMNIRQTNVTSPEWEVWKEKVNAALLAIGEKP